MHKKFLQTTSFLGMLILAGSPAKSIQRFAMAEDTLFIEVDGIRMPTRIRSLVWRGVEYEPAPNRRAKGWLEWNVAPDGYAGPAPIYGETITVFAETDYTNMHYSCFCIPYTQVESGHYTKALYKTQLLLSGQVNPECVLLHWTANGLTATAKPPEQPINLDNEGTPLKK